MGRPKERLELTRILNERTRTRNGSAMLAAMSSWGVWREDVVLVGDAAGLSAARSRQAAG